MQSRKLKKNWTGTHSPGNYQLKGSDSRGRQEATLPAADLRDAGCWSMQSGTTQRPRTHRTVRPDPSAPLPQLLSMARHRVPRGCSGWILGLACQQGYPSPAKGTATTPQQAEPRPATAWVMPRDAGLRSAAQHPSTLRGLLWFDTPAHRFCLDKPALARCGPGAAPQAATEEPLKGSGFPPAPSSSSACCQNQGVQLAPLCNTK